MNQYAVTIEKTIATTHYVYAESAESAESIVYEYVIEEKSNHQIISHNFLEEVEVTDVYIDAPRK